MSYDALIVGGGPAGLSAALMLGRAGRRVLLVDGGTPRNAAAEEVHGFVTQDGTPPQEFRRRAREQLKPYASVELRDGIVEAIHGDIDAFEARIDGQRLQTRRVLLALGVTDELPPTPGYRELWGKAIFRCPYCHGFEVRGRAFAFLAPLATLVEHGVFLKTWSKDLVVLTDGRFEVPSEAREKLAQAAVTLEERTIRRLIVEGGVMRGCEFADGSTLARDVLFAHPPQHQTPLVRALELAVSDIAPFLRVDDRQQTSRVGIYAAGDLTTPVQSALNAAAQGAMAAHWLNFSLAMP